MTGETLQVVYIDASKYSAEVYVFPLTATRLNIMKVMLLMPGFSLRGVVL